MKPYQTVKWAMPSGDVTIFPAGAVAIIGGKEMAPGDARKYPSRVEFDTGDGSDVRATIDGGTVFVMNSEGKTIDVVHLGLAPPKAG